MGQIVKSLLVIRETTVDQWFGRLWRKDILLEKKKKRLPRKSSLKGEVK